MQPLNPANIWVPNIDEFIKKYQMKEVTSHSIYEPSTTIFHPNGLFSEQIFGTITTEERLVNMGYISLRTKIFQPHLYINLLSLKRFYEDILSGSAFARFDPEEKDFVRCEKDDPEGGTGFTFFLQHYFNIEFKRNDSVKRTEKILSLINNKNNILIDKFPVLAAGLRDIRITDRGVQTEEINALYRKLLSLGQAMPIKDINSPTYDGIRFAIQNKAVDIYLYIKNIISGKSGYGQKKFTRRAIAGGSRNVISSASLRAETATDPKFLKYDEAMIGVYQASKIFQPFFIYYLNKLFLDIVFQSETSGTISLINPDTLLLEYVPVSDEIKNEYITDTGLDDLINRFETPYYRYLPVTIRSENNKQYYLYLMYDTGTEIYIFRSLQSFKETYKGNFDIKYVRPLTYLDMFYIVGFNATIDKYVLITRYPITSDESTFPAKVHLISTEESRKVIYKASTTEDYFIEYAEYPILSKNCIDTTVIHLSRLKELGADFDGDTCNVIGVWTKEGLENCKKYLQKTASLVKPSGNLTTADKHLIDLTFYNLSYIKDEKK